MINIPYKKGYIIEGHSSMNEFLFKTNGNFWFEAEVLGTNGDFITVKLMPKSLPDNLHLFRNLAISVKFNANEWRSSKRMN